MKWLKEIIREFGVVIVSMLVAGMIIGCASVPLEQPRDYMRNWNDPPPVKPMPNWIDNSWDHTKRRSPRCA